MSSHRAWLLCGCWGSSSHPRASKHFTDWAFAPDLCFGIGNGIFDLEVEGGEPDQRVMALKGDSPTGAAYVSCQMVPNSLSS